MKSPRRRSGQKSARSAAISVALLAIGCSEDEEIPGVVAIYGAPEATHLTPYPSNRYAVAADTATGVQVAVEASGTTDLVLTPGLEETVAELEAMDGFSTTGGVIVQFEGPIDVSTFALLPEQDPATAGPFLDASDYTTGEAPFILLNVDPESEGYGTPVGLVPRWWEQPKDGYYVEDEYTLLAQPAVPLRPATRYLFVVTDRLSARTGGRILRSPLSEELLTAPADDYGREVSDALGVLESSLGVARDRVALATTFVTASIFEGTFTLAEMAREAGPPALSTPFEVVQTEGSRVRLRAVYDAPEYRTPLPDARFHFDEDGRPIVQETVGLEVFLDVSDAESSEPRPVVIYAHGLAGDKDGSWGTAERLAPINAAVFAIDSPHHGSRGTGSEETLTPVARFFGVDFDEQTFVIGRARDNFRQLASDQLLLVELINSLDAMDVLPPGAPDGVPDFDTSRIFYIGHSFGSVQGATIFSLAPEITHAVWNVGGAGLMMLLRDSPLFSTVVVGSLAPDGYSDGAVARFMAVTQAIVDPGDPLNYARFAQLEPTPGVSDWAPREVLIQEVIADSIVPNSTSDALARAAGLVLINPIEPVSGLPTDEGPVSANLASGVTGALSQFDVTNGSDKAQHGDLIFAPEGLAQYLEFFESALADEHATIPPAYP